MSEPVGRAGPERPDERPGRFAGVRWLGDKRSMRVHDLDAARAACGADEVAASGHGASFGPDSLAEARNRGYRPCPHCGSLRVR